ncbi:MAG: S8 family serine peptidase [Pseudomonadota bacterium]
MARARILLALILGCLLVASSVAEAQRRIVIRPPTSVPVRPKLPTPKPVPTPDPATPKATTPRAPTPAATTPTSRPNPVRPRATVLTRAPRPSARPILTGLVADQDYRARRVLVRLTPGAVETDLAAALAAQDLSVEARHTSPLLNSLVLRLDLGTVALDEVIAALSTEAEVDLALPELLFRAVSDTPPPAPQYALASVNLPQDVEARGITVAVIDTGADLDHPELAQADVLAFSGTGEAAYRAQDHGSRLLGILAAQNRLTGLAPAARYLSAQAFLPAASGAEAVASSFDLLKALDWAAANGADVYNLSFAGAPDPLLAEALAPLVAKGAVLVAAAGNGGAEARPAFPASRAGVWGVTAIDGEGGLYAKATHGPHVDLAAPGVDILSISAGGGYGLDSGTSLAVAHVAGAAALMLSREPELDAKSVLDRLKAHAKDLGALGEDEAFGAGALNIAASLGRP